MSHVDKKRAFTLIELMLAMAFVSALLIAVAMTVIQIANTYNRGLTLKEVNQAGNDLANELQRAIATTSASSIRYVENMPVGTSVIGGRLCTGQYSYIWNTGKAITIDSEWYTVRNVYSGASSTDKIRFVKVYDPPTEYCVTANKAVAPAGAIELLDKGEHELAIHKFSITSAASAHDSITGQSLYSIAFQLGTNNQSALNLGSTGLATCKLSPDLNADPAYCYVSEFEIVARAGNAAN